MILWFSYSQRGTLIAQTAAGKPSWLDQDDPGKKEVVLISNPAKQVKKEMKSNGEQTWADLKPVESW